jgi:hypothetical protein
MSKYHISESRIDIAGPDANVFNLIGIGRKWLKQLGAENSLLQFTNEMTLNDYKHAIEVFKNWFGEDVLYNSNED